jgi:hypothetical protein
METEIKTCFGLFVKHMRSTIKNLPEYDIDNLTIQDIRGEIEVIYMKYIMASSFLISETSVGVLAYKHLKQMIDGNDINEKIIKLETEISELKNKLSVVLFPLSNQPTQTKNWFFN